jgi:hypothetical protein
VGDEQHVEQVTVATGRRAALVSLELAGQVGPTSWGGISIADEPHAYAYFTWSTTSSVFSIRGMR